MFCSLDDLQAESTLDKLSTTAHSRSRDILETLPTFNDVLNLFKNLVKAIALLKL